MIRKIKDKLLFIVLIWRKDTVQRGDKMKAVYSGEYYDDNTRTDSRLSKAIRINLIIFLVLALAAAALVYYFLNDVKDGRINVEATKMPSYVVNSGGNGNIEAGTYVYNEDLVNILLVGVDTGLGRTNNNGYNSDVLIVVSVDQKTKKVTCLSIPRDTLATFNKYNQQTLEVSGEITTKINNAFAQGGGPKKKSYQNARDAVERLLSFTTESGEKVTIPIHFHIGVNMDGIQDVVDAIGGVEITMSYDLTYYNSAMKKGATLTLNGHDALTYIRERSHIPNSNGDIDRTQRQREFVAAAAKKVKSMGAYETAAKLFEPLTKYVDTDIGLQDCLKLAKLLDGTDLENLNMKILPGKGVASGDYECDQEKKEELIIEFYFKKSS